jgi:anti-sigma B factor antagonist
MSIKLSTRQVGDVIVIDANGRITLGEGTTTFQEMIETLVFNRSLTPEERYFDSVIKGGKKVNLLLNLKGVSYVDSTGLHQLTRGFDHVTHNGGAYKLINLGKRLQDLLQITKLYTVFETFDDEDTAVRSFQ